MVILLRALLIKRKTPSIPSRMFALHIPQKGDINPLSANFSPPIRKAQYIRKKMRLTPAATPKPPLRVIVPKGTPIRTKIMHANGREYFL